jgi:hypothetical protein
MIMLIALPMLRNLMSLLLKVRHDHFYLFFRLFIASIKEKGRVFTIIVIIIKESAFLPRKQWSNMK